VKRESERIANYGPAITLKVSERAINNRVVNVNSFMTKFCGHRGRDVSGSCGDVKHLKSVYIAASRNFADEGIAGGDSAEPSVDSSQVVERVTDLRLSTIVGVEQLRNDDALHAGLAPVV
jgi:hypothetical protein